MTATITSMDHRSDTMDIENVARAVLAGIVRAVPKTADGIAETIRVTKVAKDNTVKARSSAMISTKQVPTNTPINCASHCRACPA